MEVGERNKSREPIWFYAMTIHNQSNTPPKTPARKVYIGSAVGTYTWCS